MRGRAVLVTLVVWGIAGCGGGGSRTVVRTIRVNAAHVAGKGNATGTGTSTLTARAVVVQDLESRLSDFEVAELGNQKGRDMPLPAAFAKCAGDAASAAIRNRSVAALTAPGSTDARFVSIEKKLAAACLRLSDTAFTHILVSAVTMDIRAEGLSDSERGCVMRNALAASRTPVLSRTILSFLYSSDPMGTLRRLTGQLTARCTGQPTTLAAYRSELLSTLARVAPSDLRQCVLEKAKTDLSDAGVRALMLSGATIQGAGSSIGGLLLRACQIPVGPTA